MAVIVELDLLGDRQRTHYCGELRKAHAGQTVFLAGWVDVRRDLGAIPRVRPRPLREGGLEVDPLTYLRVVELLAEGCGILVLKRLADAEAAGDRIYALIKAVGTASDGRAVGMLAPRIEGEILALRHAYAESGIDPATVELVEAHGTATAVGDAAEVTSLKAVFGELQGTTPTCALGSVKSQIGHCLPAAGSAGLIKAALALHTKVLPPTINCENPNPKLGLETSPFYINTETRPWIHGADTPRRAAVNAFGFGGINAHAVLEEYRRGADRCERNQRRGDRARPRPGRADRARRRQHACRARGEPERRCRRSGAASPRGRRGLARRGGREAAPSHPA
jgi:hypothetical protein